jgi:hypothetical protein
MYLFSRECVVASPAAMAPAKAISDYVTGSRDRELALYSIAYGAAWNRVTFSTWVDDLAAMEESTATLAADAKYQELLLAFGPHVSMVNDNLFNVVHSTSTEAELTFPNVVWSVTGVAKISKIVEATIGGTQICDAWKAATGVDATFGSAVTGQFGGIGWLSGYESFADFDKAQGAARSSEPWIAAMVGIQDFVSDELGAGVSTLYRKM